LFFENHVADSEGSAGSDVSLFSSYFKEKCYGEAEVLLTIRGKYREDFYFAVKPRFIRKVCQLRIELTFDDRLYKPTAKMNPASWIARGLLLFYRI
jgi:hypothetical protein